FVSLAAPGIGPSPRGGPAMSTDQYETGGGIRIRRTVDDIPVANAIEPLIAALDTQRGALLASNYEYPGRYTRGDMGCRRAPLVPVARGREFRVEALNPRGRVLLPPVASALGALAAIERLTSTGDTIEGAVRSPVGRFTEEDRSRQPSIFSVLRA